jgi:hypothetical protein
MRVLMLPDADFLARERDMLERLEIGLADEGARVLHAIPMSAVLEGTAGDGMGVYSTSIRWHDRGLPFTLGLRATALVRSLEAAAPVDGSVRGERLVDVVHALGEGAWSMAMTVARRTGATPALEVWSSGVVDRAIGVWSRLGSAVASGAERSGLGRGGRGGRAPMLLAAGAGLMPGLTRRVPEDRVALVPFGVHPGDAERAAIDPARGLSLTLVASGQDAAAVQAALGALELIAEGFGPILLFVDAGLARTLPIWRWAGGRNGEPPERLSVIAELEAQRELILETDMLIIPEARGEHRTIALDAMAGGCLVVARADARVDYLIDGRTAALVQEPGPAALAKVVRELAMTPERAAKLRQSAWTFINEERSASRQVRSMWQAFERATAEQVASGGGGGGGAAAPGAGS